MSAIDTRAWAKLNMYPLNSGELAVRPGLRRLYAPDGGRKFVGGFSVQNPYTPEVWHYIFDVLVGVAADLRLRIVDEDFVTWQTFSLGVNADPRVITHAIVQEQGIIASPDFPTLFFMVGSGAIFAKKVASDNVNTTAIEVPRGICCAWNNRVVIADGPSLFVSDPVATGGGDVRTYVNQNQNSRDGAVFGLHVSAGGALVALTSKGVFGLDGSATAVQIVGASNTAWTTLNHHESYTHASSCVIRGRVYALTRAGYMLVDTENDTEEVLDDPRLPRRYGPRIASADWRTARMFAGDEGPYVADGDTLSAHSLADQVRSWWRCNVGSTFRARGTLRTEDGDEMLLCEDGVYVMHGNFDGTQLLASDTAAQPKGILCGLIPSSPKQNPTVRSVQAAAALGGVGSIYMAVRGDIDSASSTPAADNRSLIIGTSSWGATGKRYQDAPLASIRAQFDLNTDEIALEVGADYPGTRLNVVVDVDMSGSAPERPTPRGNT